MRSHITANHYSNQLRKCVHVQSTVQFRFDTDLVLPYKIDEVAVVWRSRRTVVDFAEWAKEQGVDVFNAHVTDTMERLDRPEQFDVQFEFMRVPPHEWRIEAMAVVDGFAPLHVLQMNRFTDGAVMHTSFKVPDEAAYEAACDALLGAGLAPVASYQNSYGRFGYWQGLGNVYVKPRVNLRDV